MIGVLTLFIQDLATEFGCTVGLKNSVTAISVVALGTSVPGKSRKTTPFHFMSTVSNQSITGICILFEFHV